MRLKIRRSIRSIMCIGSLAAAMLIFITHDAFAYTPSGTKGFSGTFAIEQLVVWAIILAPFIMLLARFRINRDATRLIAGFRRWKLDKITGRLTNYESHTSVHGSGGNAVNTPVHISSDLHENLRLELSNGKSWDVELVNFNLSPKIEDVITIWLASRHRSDSIFAALNHKTEFEAVNAQEIFAMGTGGALLQSLKVTLMTLFLALCLIVGIFGNQAAIVLWGCVPFGVWLLRSRNISRFSETGTRPLWDATADDTQAFVRSSASG